MLVIARRKLVKKKSNKITKRETIKNSVPDKHRGNWNLLPSLTAFNPYDSEWGWKQTTGSERWLLLPYRTQFDSQHCMCPWATSKTIPQGRARSKPWVQLPVQTPSASPPKGSISKLFTDLQKAEPASAPGVFWFQILQLEIEATVGGLGTAWPWNSTYSNCSKGMNLLCDQLKIHNLEGKKFGVVSSSSWTEMPREKNSPTKC